MECSVLLLLTWPMAIHGCSTFWGYIYLIGKIGRSNFRGHYATPRFQRVGWEVASRILIAGSRKLVVSEVSTMDVVKHPLRYENGLGAFNALTAVTGGMLTSFCGSVRSYSPGHLLLNCLHRKNPRLPLKRMAPFPNLPTYLFVQSV